MDFALTPFVPNLEDLTAKRGLANVLRMREPFELKCWVLHQNGFDWLETNQLRDKIRAHFQIWESGKITQNAHILARLISSSNAANKDSISIEFDGNFEGNPGKGNFWKPDKYGKNILTVAQVMSARRLMRAVQKLVPTINAIYAHRQFGITKTGKANRPLCPGHEIWTHVGEWAKQEFGYSDGGPNWHYRAKGKAAMSIPDDWRGTPMPDEVVCH